MKLKRDTTQQISNMPNVVGDYMVFTDSHKESIENDRKVVTV